MRTTVDIPDAIYRRLKSRAASEGRTTKALILRGVNEVLRTTRRKRLERSRCRSPIQAALVQSSSTMPESTRSSLFPDINVWIALSYEGHAHHATAVKWFTMLIGTRA